MNLFQLKIKHKKFKKSLGQLYIPFVCFIATFIWSISVNHFIDRFNAGYLSYFNIHSKLSITEITSHSKWTFIIVFSLILIMFFYLISFLNNYLKNNYKFILKLRNFIIYFILIAISIFITFYGFFIYMFYIDNLIPFEDVIRYLSKEKMTILAMTCIITIYISISAQVIITFENKTNNYKLNTTRRKFNIQFDLQKLFVSYCILTAILSIGMIDYISSSLGNVFASFEIAYPYFYDTKSNVEYIVIAKSNDLSLVVNVNSINQKDKKGEILPTNYIFKNIESIELTDRSITIPNKH